MKISSSNPKIENGLIQLITMGKCIGIIVLSPMKFPTLIFTAQFPFKMVLDGIFHWHSNFNRKSSKKTEEALIRYHAMSSDLSYILQKFLCFSNISFHQRIESISISVCNLQFVGRDSISDSWARIWR